MVSGWITNIIFKYISQSFLYISIFFKVQHTCKMITACLEEFLSIAALQLHYTIHQRKVKPEMRPIPEIHIEQR